MGARFAYSLIKRLELLPPNGLADSLGLKLLQLLLAQLSNNYQAELEGGCST